MAGGEGEWPTIDELEKMLDGETSSFTDQLTRHLAAAIEQVKLDVGDWDDATDEPDASLADAALVLAIRISGFPAKAATAPITDGDYHRLLKGHRRRFAIG